MPSPLVATWRHAHHDFREVAERAPWRSQTLLPGWTVADLVAHTVWIERLALGRSDPPHEPVWSTLPHVGTDFGRISEVPVDLRRTRSRETVLAELDATLADRETMLQDTDPDADATDVFGRKRTLDEVLRDRIFDLWVHEQDIRVPLGEPGHLDDDGARITAEVLLAGLGFLWAKRAGAPVGTSLVVRTTPPGLAVVAAVRIEADGRARPCAVPQDPTATLTLGFPNFVALACGRMNADTGAVVVAGDQDLGARVVEDFAITP